MLADIPTRILLYFHVFTSHLRSTIEHHKRQKKNAFSIFFFPTRVKHGIMNFSINMELLCLRFNVLFIMDALVNFTSGEIFFFFF